MIKKEVRLAQGTIRYQDTGSGPVLLFVHGLLVNGGLWRKVVPLLADQYRCIVPDLPLGAHSLPMDEGAEVTPHSVADMLVQICDRLDLREVTLVGNDTGGALCQLAVTGHPNRFKGLVLTSCDGFEVFPPKMFAGLVIAGRSPVLLHALMQVMRIPLVRHSPLGFGWLSHNGIDDPAVEASFLAPILGDARVRRDTSKFLRATTPAVTLEAGSKLGRFRGPVLVAWGADERVFPVALGKRIAAAFPNARFETIAGARTFVCEDQPERLAQRMRAFLEADAAHGLRSAG